MKRYINLIAVRFLIVIIIPAVLAGCTTPQFSLHAAASLKGTSSVGRINYFKKEIGSFENWTKVGNIKPTKPGYFLMSDICNDYFKAGMYDISIECINHFENTALKEYYELLETNKNFRRNVGSIRTSFDAYYSVKQKLSIIQGDYKKAFSEGVNAINKLKRQGKYNRYPEVPTMELVINTALVALKLNMHDEAKKYEREFSKFKFQLILEEPNISRNRRALLAKLYLAQGKYKKAREIIEGSDTFTTVLARTTWAILSLGMTEIMLKDDIVRSIDPFILDEVYMHAKICLELNDIECAEASYDKLIKGEQNISVSDNLGLYSLLEHDVGKMSLRAGNKNAALSHYKKSIELIEQQRSKFNTETTRIGFIGDKLAVYKDTVDLLVKMGLHDEALEYVERGKSRALIEILASKENIGNNNKAKILVATFNDVHDSNSVQAAYTNPKQFVKQRSVHRALLRKRATDLLETQPELASLVTVSAPSISSLQKLLPVGETLVEYYGDNKQLYAFVMSRSGVGAVKLNAKNINQSIHDFRNALMKPKSRAYKKLGFKLYSQLISPVVKQIKTKNITFVPHGALHYLPFSALNTPEGHLIDTYNIRVLPSASVMNFLNKKSNAKGSLLALGNPDLNDEKLDLPGAQKEAISITRKQKGAKLLLRDKATETAVKQYGSNYKYLHFASHGVFDPDKPLQSGLLLSKDASNDGNLTVGELYNLNLNADLVTLSACETALGKVANGDDVVGFTRGFLYAGAKSIVSSLWKVDDDATNKLMQSFYTNLKRTDKRSALRTAQLSVKKQYSHPYYWAAFQITGAIN